LFPLISFVPQKSAFVDADIITFQAGQQTKTWFRSGFWDNFGTVPS